MQQGVSQKISRKGAKAWLSYFVLKAAKREYFFDACIILVV